MLMNRRFSTMMRWFWGMDMSWTQAGLKDRRSLVVVVGHGCEGVGKGHR